MKLDPEEGPVGVLHGLDGAGVVSGRSTEVRGQVLDLVAVGMPDRYGRRQILEDSAGLAVPYQKDGVIASLSESARITLAGRRPFHQINASPVGQGYLLMPPANPQDGLRRLTDNRKDSCQRLWLVILPRITLAAENYVAGMELLDVLRGNGREGLQANLNARSDALKRGAQLPRARSLAVNRVID